MAVKRDWLNPVSHADTGHVHSEVRVDGRGDFEGSLDIADCSRKISLDFSIYGSDAGGKNLASRLKKIEVLRKHLDLIEKGLQKYESLL